MMLILNNQVVDDSIKSSKSMAKSCEDEYNSIIHRIKGGYETFIEKYKKGETSKRLGRQGYHKSDVSYANDYSKEINLLQTGKYSMRQIRTITGVSLGTLQKLKRLFPKEGVTIQDDSTTHVLTPVDIYESSTQAQ